MQKFHQGIQIQGKQFYPIDLPIKIYLFICMCITLAMRICTDAIHMDSNALFYMA